MSTTYRPTYDDVLTTVSEWPADQRMELVQDVLQTLRPAPSVNQDERQAALQRLDGILAGYGPPPSDDDVRRWLDERRMEKYG